MGILTETTLLIKHAEMLVTMDEQRREIRDGGLFIKGNQILAVGPTKELPETADSELDMTGHIVIPGLINTHHHMYQSLTRVIPDAQDGELFTWLKSLYPIWERLTPEMIHVSTQTAMAELILSGCTTSSDHLYVYPNGCRLDDSIGAADEIGMRFHPSRGSMSVGESKGGLPPDTVVEEEEAILRDTQRLIESYHDPSRYSMRRLVVAPCSPFSVSQELMRDSAELARRYGVSMHTHLAENVNDIAYSREHFGCTPAEYAEQLGWLGHDVWHAHCVQLDDTGIGRFAATQTGVAHCPCSNMRLGSGIAPITKMLEAGVPVGLGVDGSASNDGSHLLNEARQAMLLQRVRFGPGAMTARAVLEIGTLGGARVLNRDDIGALAPGKAADLAAFDLHQLNFAGALHDPVAATLFCSSPTVAYSVINGRVIVDQGQLMTVDLRSIITRHNQLARSLCG